MPLPDVPDTDKLGAGNDRITETNRYVNALETRLATTESRANSTKAEVDAANSVAVAGRLMQGGTDGRITIGYPVNSDNAANKQYVDNKFANISLSSRVAVAGDTMTGNLRMSGAHIYVPDSSSASSGYVVAYINGDGRICKGASSLRYKTAVHRAGDLGDLAGLELKTYRMKDDPDGHEHVGYIAEELVGTPAERFVVYDDQGRPDAIDYIELLLAKIASLEGRLEAAGI